MKSIAAVAALALALIGSAHMDAQSSFLYTFDESMGSTIVDGTGGGYHLRLGRTAGNDVFDPTIESDHGDPGLAGDRRLRFDGVDDFAYSPTFPWNDAVFTLECRFTRTQTAALFKNEVLLSTYGLGSGGFELRIDNVLGSANMAFVWRDRNGVETAVRGGAPVQYGRSYHVAVVYFNTASVTTAALYLDGATVGVWATANRPISFNGTGGLYIGNNADGSRLSPSKTAFAGTLDDIRMAPVALDATQIADRTERRLNALFHFGGANHPGGELFLGPEAPAEGNKNYLCVISATPASGLRLPGRDGRPVPIGIDGLTHLAVAGTSLSTDVFGTMSPDGWGLGKFLLPDIPQLAQQTIYGCFVVTDPGAPNGIRRISLPSQVKLGNKP